MSSDACVLTPKLVLPKNSFLQQYNLNKVIILHFVVQSTKCINTISYQRNELSPHMSNIDSIVYCIINMECVFCKNHCFVNKHYCFLQGIQMHLSRSSVLDPNHDHFKLYTSFMEKVHGTHLGHHN